MDQIASHLASIEFLSPIEAVVNKDNVSINVSFCSIAVERLMEKERSLTLILFSPIPSSCLRTNGLSSQALQFKLRSLQDRRDQRTCGDKGTRRFNGKRETYNSSATFVVTPSRASRARSVRPNDIEVSHQLIVSRAALA